VPSYLVETYLARGHAEQRVASEQRARCLASLLHDGLVVQVSEDTFALP
jgi:hypothetical protein